MYGNSVQPRRVCDPKWGVASCGEADLPWQCTHGTCFQLVLGVLDNQVFLLIESMWHFGKPDFEANNHQNIDISTSRVYLFVCE